MDWSRWSIKAVTPKEVARIRVEHQITMEWNDNEGSGWQPSQSRRSGTYTIKEGLMIQLGAKDNWPRRGDGDRDFNNLVLACKFVDPTLNPKPPDNLYDFTIGDSDSKDAPKPPIRTGVRESHHGRLRVPPHSVGMAGDGGPHAERSHPRIGQTSDRC
jgi:hypothetical protein